MRLLIYTLLLAMYFMLTAIGAGYIYIYISEAYGALTLAITVFAGIYLLAKLADRASVVH